MKRIFVISFFILFVVFFALHMPDAFSKDRTIDGKLDVDISGVTYSTLTLIKCTNVDITNCNIWKLVINDSANVDIINCIIGNLISEDSMNIDIERSTFNGTGTAITVRKVMSLTVEDTNFTGKYDQILSKSKSVDIDIE